MTTPQSAKIVAIWNRCSRSISQPFWNAPKKIMIFFGAFQKGWEIERLHLFQIATILALWGVVISAVYMLRAYRSAFMGSMPERWGERSEGRRVGKECRVGG